MAASVSTKFFKATLLLMLGYVSCNEAKVPCKCTGNKGFWKANDRTVTDKNGKTTLKVRYNYGKMYGQACLAHDQGKEVKSHKHKDPWKFEPWCYIPCDCEPDSTPRYKTSFLWNASLSGVQLCYSYEHCGGVDYFQGYAAGCMARGGQQFNDQCTCDLGFECHPVCAAVGDSLPMVSKYANFDNCNPDIPGNNPIPSYEVNNSVLTGECTFTCAEGTAVLSPQRPVVRCEKGHWKVLQSTGPCVPVPKPKVLRVCAAPSAGFWMYEGSEEALSKLIHGEWHLRHKNPKFKVEQSWKLNGFAAELLLSTKELMGADGWDFTVQFYRASYQALYAAVAEGECDVAFHPFVVTANRAYCGTASLRNGVKSCMVNPPNGTPTARHACCAAFSLPMRITTIGVILNEEKNLRKPNHAIIFEQINYLWHVLVLGGTGVIGFAHIVWLAEKTQPATNAFARDYITGIMDAIWWAIATTTSVGYGDVAPATTWGRCLAILTMLSGLVGFAFFTGAITSLLTEIERSEAASNRYLYTSVGELPDSIRICVPNPTYSSTYRDIRRLRHYHPPSKSPIANLATCFMHFESGYADAIAYDEPILLHAVNRLGITNAYFMKGTEEIVMASAWSARYVNTHRNAFEQSLIVTMGKAKHFDQVFESYFPSIDRHAPNADAPDWPMWLILMIAFASVYSFCFTIALIVRDVKLGRCKRCGNLIKNSRRSRRLRKIHSSVHSSASLEPEQEYKIPDSLVATFQAIDDNGNGYLEMHELEAFIQKLATTDLTPDAIAQVKQMLLTIFANDVDGRITLEEFSDAYKHSVSSTVDVSLTTALGTSPKRKKKTLDLPPDVRTRMEDLRTKTKELRELIGKTYTR